MYVDRNSLEILSRDRLLKKNGLIKKKGAPLSSEDISLVNAAELDDSATGDVQTGKAIFNEETGTYQREYRSYTDEELQRQAKRQRALDVAAIKVTTSTGKTFDGDETSQGRMSRAISVSSPGEATFWILADNTISEVTHEELKEALRLAGEAQTNIWVS